MIKVNIVSINGSKKETGGRKRGNTPLTFSQVGVLWIMTDKVPAGRAGTAARNREKE